MKGSHSPHLIMPGALSVCWKSHLSLAEAGPPWPPPGPGPASPLSEAAAEHGQPGLGPPRRDPTGPASGMQLEPHGRFSPDKSLAPGCRGKGRQSTFHTGIGATEAGGKLRGHKLPWFQTTRQGREAQDPSASYPRSLESQGRRGSELKRPSTVFKACTHFTDGMAGA